MVSFTRRSATTTLFSIAAAGAGLLQAKPVLAYNCVNVVLRDPYWGQYRRIVESGWNAAGVGNAFARNGFAVDNQPGAGAIVVWPPNYYGASASGHVGIVAGVNGNGSITVRHENWPYGSAEHLQVFAVHPALQFVHQADAVQTAGTDEGTPGGDEGA